MAGLGTFPPILLAREQRFFPTASQLQDFLEHTIDLDLWATPRDSSKPVEYVRTTYFDSEDLELYQSTLKRRVRLREYARAGASNETPILDRVCYLEVKQVRGSLRAKMRVELERTSLVRPDGSLDVLKALQVAHGRHSPLFAAVGVPLRSLRPCVTVCFRRVSLGGRPQRLRVTLDHGITFSLPGRLADNPGAPENVLGYGPLHVLEVKHEGALPEWLTDALCVLPPRSQVSKFELAVRTALSGAQSSTRHKASIDPIPFVDAEKRGGRR